MIGDAPLVKAKRPEQEAAADAAYERGWVDSLDAYDRISLQPTDDIYWYRIGWDTCAKYRWEDPKNRGRALDRNYRIARKAAPL